MRSRKTGRKPSKQNNLPPSNVQSAEYESADQEDEIAFENDDSASEASNHSTSISTASKRKKDAKAPIDESGHRRSTQVAKKRGTELVKRRY